MDATVDRVDIKALLRNAHTSSATGFLFIFFEVGNRQEHGNITIREGQIVDAIFGCLSGSEILSVLLNIPSPRAYFVKSSRAALVSGNNFPDIPTVLNSLVAPKHPEPKPTVDLFNLVRATQSIFEEAYGNQGLVNIQELTKLYPPERDPVTYLNQCKESVRSLFDDEKTEAKFAALYRMAIQL